MTIHDDALAASQEQSRVVLTWRLPAAPAAGAVSSELVIDTAHFAAEGVVTDRSLELHAASSRAIPANATQPIRDADI